MRCGQLGRGRKRLEVIERSAANLPARRPLAGAGVMVSSCRNDAFICRTIQQKQQNLDKRLTNFNDTAVCCLLRVQVGGVPEARTLQQQALTICVWLQGLISRPAGSTTTLPRIGSYWPGTTRQSRDSGNWKLPLVLLGMAHARRHQSAHLLRYVFSEQALER